ncbi:MAG TPA: hypothetical protein VMT43_11285, partial [Acidimicrobiales bacterium]|nr:hypothetical protein [Acidimicrobiales bacterium]
MADRFETRAHPLAEATGRAEHQLPTDTGVTQPGAATDTTGTTADTDGDTPDTTGNPETSDGTTSTDTTDTTDTTVPSIDTDGVAHDLSATPQQIQAEVAAAAAAEPHQTVTELDGTKVDVEPWNRDSDGDGIDDATELSRGMNPFDKDTDHDGWTDDVDVAPKIPNLNNDPSGNADYDNDGVSNADERILGTNPFGRTDPTGMTDRQYADSVFRQWANNASGGAIGKLGVLKDHGVVPTQAEIDAAQAQAQQAISSTNILVRAQGYAGLEIIDGTQPPAEFTQQFAQYQQDAQDATLNRDEGAFARAFQAVNGAPPTAQQIAQFNNPSAEDVIAAQRQAALSEVDTTGTKLDQVGQQMLNDMHDATLNRDEGAFARAFQAVNGAPPTAEQIAQFNNPSAEDVIAAQRQAQLEGLDTTGTKLDQVSNQVFGDTLKAAGIQPDQPTDGSSGSGTPGTTTTTAGTSSGTTTDTGGHGTDAGLAGLDPFNAKVDQPSTSSDGSTPGVDTQGQTPGDTPTDTPGETPGDTSGPSAIDQGLANLSGGPGTDAEPDIPTSRGEAPDTTPPSEPDMSSFGDHSGSGGAGSGTGGPDVILDDDGMTTIGGQDITADSVTTDLPGGASSTMTSDGTTTITFTDGSQATLTGGDFGATSQPSGDRGGTSGGTDPGGSTTGSGTDSGSSTSGGSSSGGTDSGSSTSGGSDTGTDDHGAGMTDPDADPTGGVTMVGTPILHD